MEIKNNLFKRFYEKIFSAKESKYFFISLILIFIAIIAITSITEITRRQQFITSTKKQTDIFREKYTDLYKKLTLNLESLSAQTEDNLKDNLKVEKKEIKHELENLENKINRYQNFKNSAISLYRNGAEYYEETLNSILRDERHFLHGTDTLKFSKLEHKFLNNLFEKKISSYFFNIKYVNSDFLIALIIISCTILGSLIGSFRSYETISIKNIALGIGTGFITFIAIKGGKSVFLLEFYQTDPVPLNPYSTAFAAIITGLFSDKFFGILTNVVDKVSKQIENSITPADNNS